MTKELLFSWAGGGLQVLVPKKRGQGFLKVPYGHHINKALDDIADLVQCDICGLDGALFFECSFKTFSTESLQTAFAAKVVKPLEAHYGFPSRFIHEKEFFELHPAFTSH